MVGDRETEKDRERERKREMKYRFYVYPLIVWYKETEFLIHKS